MTEKEALRRSLPEAPVLDLSEAARSLPLYHAARRVALYRALPDEPSLDGLFSDEKEFYLPRCEGREMKFLRFVGRLTPDRFGILAPDGEELSGEPDLIFVPGLAFTALGVRLGRGCGYYDRFLAGVSCPAVGVVCARRVLPGLPEEAHDRRVDFLLTERGLTDCAQAQLANDGGDCLRGGVCPVFGV